MRKFCIQLERRKGDQKKSFREKLSTFCEIKLTIGYYRLRNAIGWKVYQTVSPTPRPSP